MKLIKSINFLVYAIVAISLLSSCSEGEKPIELGQVDKTEPNAHNPFPFYKSMEIKPGLNFEVLSWGKGIDTLGGYLILMSDSIKNNYKSLSVERKGILVDAWNMDLDNDGNPELYVQYVVRKNVNDVNVYEYANGSFDKLSFRSLKSIKGYNGNDSFFVKNGDLFRKVPTISIDSGNNTTLVKTLKYSLKGNSFSTSEVK